MILFHEKNTPLCPNVACVQLWMYGRGFEPPQAFAFLFCIRVLFFSFFHIYFLRSLLLLFFINLPHGLMCTKSSRQ